MTQPAGRNGSNEYPGAKITRIRPLQFDRHRIHTKQNGPAGPASPTSPTRQEYPAMNGSLSMLNHSIARQRSDEIQAQAERDRLVAQINRENGIPTIVQRVRRIAGDALVRTGTLVGGQRAERPVAADRVTGATVLRIAR